MTTSEVYSIHSPEERDRQSKLAQLDILAGRSNLSKYFKDPDARDHMVQNIGELHVRGLSEKELAKYVLDRFGFLVAPGFRDFSGDPESVLYQAAVSERSALFITIGEDVLDIHLNEIGGRNG